MALSQIKFQTIIDRIEEEKIAVLELPDMTTLEIDKKFLPVDVKEGNVLDVKITINPEKEKELKEEVNKLQEELLNRTKNKN